MHEEVHTMSEKHNIHGNICYNLPISFFFRDDQRSSSNIKTCSSRDGQCQKDSIISNGVPIRRPTLICPERLRDFGAEEYLNGDVRHFKTKVAEVPEMQLMAPPKPSIQINNDIKPAPKPPAEYLSFEDISAAVLNIQQAGIQKTPCTVCQPQHVIFKQEFRTGHPFCINIWRRYSLACNNKSQPDIFIQTIFWQFFGPNSKCKHKWRPVS